MRLESISLVNFRGYQGPVKVLFDDLTAFVGKNDVGKSTVLEALDIFFNDSKGTVKFDAGDIMNVCPLKIVVRTMMVILLPMWGFTSDEYKSHFIRIPFWFTSPLSNL
ncbi:MAG: ATP-binding protein [Lachnospiraceae bacterium]|nr:ATP-binding protein [Lachnospiraceae bacterium]